MTSLKFSRTPIVKARMRSDIRENGESIPFKFESGNVVLEGYMHPTEAVFNVRMPDAIENDEYNLEVRINQSWYRFIGIDFEYAPFKKD